MTKSTKNIFAVIGSSFCGTLLALLLTNKVPFYISEFLPVFAAGCTAACLSSMKGWSAGSATAVLMALFSVTVYLTISGAELKSALALIIDPRVVAGYLIYLLFGIAGAYIGSLLKKLLIKNN